MQARGLLLVGGAVPIFGSVCTTAREVLSCVERVARKVADVLEMGERVIDALMLLERMSSNMENMESSEELRHAVQLSCLDR